MNKLLDFVRQTNNSDVRNTIKQISKKDVAIIGISARLPFAENADEFWDNMKNGVDCLGDLPTNRKKDANVCLGFSNYDSVGVNYCKANYLQDIDKFDYEFFGISPKEASLMDPNQRLFLESAWKVIEDAGYGNRINGTRTGVFLGYKFDEYYDYKKLILDVEPQSLLASFNGNLTAITPSRISYILNLRGPSMLIETACSSSLLAVHLACQSIRNNECEMAIAGGLKVSMIPLETKEKLGIESSDGRARTFDERSDGTSMGEGIISILLKPLNLAIRDKDSIYAVIKGSSSNQDGKSIGLTAPNVLAQEDLIVKAWKDAEVDPETISFIETHGTATKLGDPIEIDGINRAFKKFTNKKQFCAVSSIKSNIGHLDNAAGMAGLLQCVMALKNKQIPPVFHFNKPNKKIDFIDSAVYVNKKLSSWKSTNVPRRCGVSSFGFSGTNCHVVLEEAPTLEVSSIKSQKDIFTISAKSLKSLSRILDNLKDYDFKGNINDICFTQNTGRWHHNYRIAFVVESTEELIKKLNLINLSNLKGMRSNGIFYKKHKLVINKSDKQNASDILVSEANERASAIEEKFLKNNELFLSEDFLNETCNAYVDGANLNWNIFYENENRQKLNLPSYEFQRKRCWVKWPQHEINDIYYDTYWEPSTIDINQSEYKNNEKNTVLIIGNSSKMKSTLTEAFEKSDCEVIRVNFGAEFKVIGEKNFTVGNKEDDYLKLCSKIPKNISKLIFVSANAENSSSDTISDLQKYMDSTLFGLVFLIKSLMKSHINEIEFDLVCDNVNLVDNEKLIKPENSMIFGLSKSIIWENPGYRFKCIDIDGSTDVDEVLNEILHGKDYLAVYRNHKRYVQKIKKASLENNDLRLKSDGVYVVTGGMGGIGLEIIKTICEIKNVNLAILGRTKLPEKKDYRKILKQSKDLKLKNIVQALNELDDIDAMFKYYPIDICDENRMQKLFNDLRDKYGRINGIIHCAGVTDGNILKNESEKTIKKVLLPKVFGTYLLDKLTCNDDLDLFVMCSSAITLTGKISGLAYTTANTYLDAFSDYRKALGKNVLCIDWASWQETGMIKNTKINENKEIFEMLKPQIGVVAFKKLIFSKSHKVIVGKLNTKSQTFELKNYLPFSFDEEVLNVKEKGEGGETSNISVGDVILTGNDDGNYTSTQQAIGNIWKEILGFEKINVKSSFFEIGGDSVMVTRMHSKFQELFSKPMSIAEMFAYTTIEKQAEFFDDSFEDISINETISEKNELDDIIEMLESDN